MVILHIASVNDDLCAGVSVAVPQHVISQQTKAEVGFVNLTNIKIAGIKNQFEYNKSFSVKNLPHPFSNPDIVVFHEIYRPQFSQISYNLRKNNVPYIITAHGGFSKEAQKKKKLKKLLANNTFFPIPTLIAYSPADRFPQFGFKNVSLFNCGKKPLGRKIGPDVSVGKKNA